MYSVLILVPLLFITCLLELVTMPFAGTLVRFRANYSPKGLQLDQEGGVQPHAGPVVNSYFGMMRRVLRLEGWRGLYKGFMPGIITVFLVSLFTSIYIGMPGRHGKYSAPAATPFQMIVYAVFLTLVGLPLTILINRAVTTPYLLPWTNAHFALHHLFTPSELRKPWVIFLTPGLLAAKALHLLYITCVLHTFRSLLLPSLDSIAKGPLPGHNTVPPDFTLLRIGTYLFVAALSTVVLCPLEVLATRLSLQRNHDSDTQPHTQDGLEVGTGLNVEEAQYAGTEDVVGLRNEFDPYVSLMDAVKRMRDEEGWRALYRGWWVTSLALMLGGFV